mmetsp:Transcript_61914/g.75902  ORF Transcript_61914/g.75902 Transcript_61914/m.75902 type:complete len:376 (-) Transcript_61914:175-1302(-)
MSKSREVISIHVGQAGIQTGTSLWEQYCKEHKIGLDGVRKAKKYRMKERIRFGKNGGNGFENAEAVPEDELYIPNGKKNKNKDNRDSLVNDDEKKQEDLRKNPAVLESRVFFSHNDANDTHTPRALMLDLEPNVIDNMMSSDFGGLFKESTLMKGKEDAANNFARGRYTIGKEYEDIAKEALRKEYEICDHVQGFLFNFAVGGGTGSGFGAKILERINVDYRRKPIYSFGVLCDVDQIGFQYYNAVYNQLLIMAKLLDFTKMTYLFDNIQMKNIFTSNQISGLNYNGYNTLITKAISSITQLMRFGGYSMQRLIDEMILFPRINQILTGISPIISINNLYAIFIDISSSNKSILINPVTLSKFIVPYTVSLHKSL